MAVFVEDQRTISSGFAKVYVGNSESRVEGDAPTDQLRQALSYQNAVVAKFLRTGSWGSVVEKELERLKQKAERPSHREGINRVVYMAAKKEANTVYMYDTLKKTFPTTLLKRVLRVFRKVGIEYELVDQRQAPKGKLQLRFDERDHEPRDYQIRSVEIARHCRCGAFALATNAGKTGIMLRIVAESGLKTLILVQKQELLFQISDAIQHHLHYEAGLVGAGKFKLKPITVAIVNSAHTRIQELVKYGFNQVFVDEGHHAASRIHFTVLSKLKPYRIYSMTGTDFRNRNDENIILEAAFGGTVQRIDNQFMVDQGYSARMRAEIIDCKQELHPSFSWRRVYERAVIHSLTRSRLMVEAVARHARADKTVLVLTEETGHGQTICNLLSSAGLDVKFMHGAVSRDERTAARLDFKDRKFQVLVGCLSAETRVRLLDGRTLSMAEIHASGEKDLWTYSVDTDGRFVPGRIKRSIEYQPSELVRVRLDNKAHVDCTPDHPFLMRDGSWKEAADLAPGDSLMPLYTRVRDKGRCPGYEEIYDPASNSWRYTHRQMMVADTTHELDGDYWVIHHKDFDKFNNAPTNLKWMPSREHWEFHCRHGGNVFNRLWQDTEFRAMVTERQQERGGEYSKKFWDSLSGEEKNELLGRSIHRPDVLERNRERMREAARNKSPEHRESLRKKMLEINTEADRTKLNNGRYRTDIEWEDIQALAEEGLTLAHAASVLNCSQKVVIARIRLQGHNSWSDLIEHLHGKRRAPLSRVGKGPNHKVVSVEDLPDPEPVYDLEIEDWKNFALACGVVVHNTTIYDEGVDFPTLDVVAFAGGKKAKGKVFQRLGRGQRRGFHADGTRKDVATVIDFFDHGHRLLKKHSLRRLLHMHEVGVVLPEKYEQLLVKEGLIHGTGDGSREPSDLRRCAEEEPGGRQGQEGHLLQDGGRDVPGEGHQGVRRRGRRREEGQGEPARAGERAGSQRGR